jgi:hypothetical protein
MLRDASDWKKAADPGILLTIERATENISGEFLVRFLDYNLWIKLFHFLVVLD